MTQQTNNLPVQPSRQARRQQERQQMKTMKRHLNETIHGKNKKR